MMHQVSHGSPSKERAKKSAFERTELCQFFMQNRCNRGKACTFSHSLTSLRRKPNLYRTRLCQELEASGSCAQGDSCCFAHSLEERDQHRAIQGTVRQKARRPTGPPQIEAGIEPEVPGLRENGDGKDKMKMKLKKQPEDGIEPKEPGLQVKADVNSPTHTEAEADFGEGSWWSRALTELSAATSSRSMDATSAIDEQRDLLISVRNSFLHFEQWSRASASRRAKST
mmetsp:Transcript_17676/g.30931  ORF Transcript_17676/g.30931 Transcript_17676/m.30931 type:complete len:227 (+) Transcript_17676:49-729(+)